MHAMPAVRMSVRLLTVAVAALVPLLGVTPARAAGFSTGPVDVAAAGTAQTVVSSVRAGHHAGFDRVVFTFAGPVPGYSVAYVPQVIQDGSGAPLTLSGTSFVAVTLRGTSTSTHAPQQRTSPRFPMLRDLVGAGDFEGVTTYGVGLAGRSGLRASTLTGPNRLVVDFAIPGGTRPGGADQVAGTGAGSPTGGSATTTPGTAAAAPPGADVPPSPDSGTPALPLLLGGAGLLVAALAGYHVLRRRPA